MNIFSEANYINTLMSIPDCSPSDAHNIAVWCMFRKAELVLIPSKTKLLNVLEYTRCKFKSNTTLSHFFLDTHKWLDASFFEFIEAPCLCNSSPEMAKKFDLEPTKHAQYFGLDNKITSMSKFLIIAKTLLKNLTGLRELEYTQNELAWTSIDKALNIGNLTSTNLILHSSDSDILIYFEQWFEHVSVAIQCIVDLVKSIK